MKKYTFLAVALAWLTNAGAHNLWLMASDYYPAAGKTIDIRIGWGHKFPKDETLKDGMLKYITALDPDGKETPLIKKAADHFTLQVKKEGVYTVTAGINPVFFSQTTQGRKKGSRKEHPKAVSCTHYEIGGKLIIMAGGKTKGLSPKTGQSLEMLPIKAGGIPLGKGAELSLSALFKGKPLSNLQIFATYDGFSDDAHTFAYATRTDKDGHAKIKLHEKGLWIIKADSETTYTDNKECDKNSYRMTFTLKVQ